MDYTLAVANSHNVVIYGISITNGRGVGILLYNVFTSCVLSNSVFVRNDINCYIAIEQNPSIMRAYEYNGVFLIYKINITHGQNRDMMTSGIEIRTLYVTKLCIRIIDMMLVDNYANKGQFEVSLMYFSVDVEIDHLIVTGESIQNNGMRLDGNKLSMGKVSIIDSHFIGTCLKVSTDSLNLVLLKDSVIKSCRGIGLELSSTNMQLHNVQIAHNMGNMVEITTSTELTIEGNCTFYNNTGTFLIDNLDAKVIFGELSTTVFENNLITCIDTCCQCSTLNLYGASIEIRNASVYFKNNIAIESGGMLIGGGSLHFFGNSSIVFEGNIGNNGGAMAIKSDTAISAKNGLPTIQFTRNRARHKGGAIYMAVDLFSYYICSLDSLVLFHFINNTASEAGSAIYGNMRSIMESDQNPLLKCDPDYIYIEGESNDYSEVSSDPVRVCMCANSIPNCSITEHQSDIFPGQIYKIEVVAVGLRFGTVPSTVGAEYERVEYSWMRIGGGQYLQHVDTHCTTLRYETVLDSIQMKQLTLTTNDDNVMSNYIKQKSNNNLLTKNLVISFKVKNCSLGFTFLKDQYRCACSQVLKNHGIQCNLVTLDEIFRVAPKWINATFTHNKGTEPGVIVHNHCPFDYCRSDTQQIALNLEYPDHQCAFNRSGTLCGACATNLSHVFGTSQCKQCSSLWVLLYVPIFALAGFILVVFLTTLNMTVSIGTINGLIFYANIVRANQAIFFTPDTTNSFLSRFIAWLNLDIGIEICFYHGLDAYFKTWLQFIFPLYIWLIVITIIVLSRYYTTFARLSGSNAVQVLATLFLLSYAKLLRNIVTVFQPTTLVYPDGYNRRVWLYDGNIDYFKGKHIPLFIAALLLLVLLSIPYTTILLTIQWLQKRNEYRVLFWVRKFKPLFDAYTGPYKESHRFWTGLLLLIRVVLFLIFSLNTANNPSINLLAINATTIIILTHLSLVGGVYESRLTNITEVSFLLNIGLLSAATFYQVNTSGNKTQITYTSTGVAFVSFMAITFYHVITKLLETRRGSEFKRVMESKFKENIVDRVNVIAASTPAPVTRSTIELREPLLVT